MEKTLLINQLTVISKHMKTLEKLQQIKEMNTQLVVCWTTIIPKTIIR